jgi:O-antigen/teichoic acid export membrane protein
MRPIKSRNQLLLLLLLLLLLVVVVVVAAAAAVAVAAAAAAAAAAVVVVVCLLRYIHAGRCNRVTANTHMRKFASYSVYLFINHFIANSR